MRSRASVLGWAICLLSLLVVATTAGLAIVNHDAIHSLDQANVVEIAVPIGYAILGSLVVGQQPGNALGWIFLAIAFLNALPGATTQYTVYAFATEPNAPFSPWIPWMGWLAGTLVYPGGLANMALLLMPNGRLPSRRWVAIGWAGVIVTVALLAFELLDPTLLTLPGLADIPNPTGVPGLEGMNRGVPGSIGFVVGMVILAASAASLVIRYRQAQGEERQQLRWLAFTTAFAVGINMAYTFVALLFLPQEAVENGSLFVVIAGFAIALPAGMAVAILRYRLYDLDLFLNRTVLYGAVTVVVLLIFGLADVLAQRALQSLFNQRSELLAIGLGLAAGLAFGPVRRWLRPFVDRALPARSRLALLFTDIVESTQAIVDLGDARWREVLDQYRSLVRQLLARHRGREVNTAGDAFFAVFDRPERAMACAMAMRDEVATLGLRVRTGLHLGDVEVRGEQVTGLAVHAAARIMAKGGAGQIVLSEDFASALPDGTSLRDTGRHALRGVPGEWRLYQTG